MLTLILGGTRSGKSKFALTLCHDVAPVTYIATARIEDAEMRERVERHRRSRPSSWCTIEESLKIGEAVRHTAVDSQVVLIDCLTVWLSNVLWEMRTESAGAIENAVCREMDGIAQVAASTQVVAVSNEVGSSIVPESSLGRRFRDLQGLLNQHTASIASHVILVVAGIPISIKATAPEIASISLQP